MVVVVEVGREVVGQVAAVEEGRKSAGSMILGDRSAKAVSKKSTWPPLAEDLRRTLYHLYFQL